MMLVTACANTVNPAASIQVEPSGKKSLGLEGGIQALRVGNTAEAIQLFNRALAISPENTNIHLLAGLAYHLHGTKGDPATVELAEVGYSVAARLDPSNALAQLQLGRLNFEKKNYLQAQAAFAVDREETKTRDEYGRHEFGQSALLARRLVENGVRFVTINYGGWDHHGEIFKGLDSKLPEFDQGYSALIHDLDQRGLLDSTLVLAMGEFGRTPKVNDKAGRDHWGRAGSMLWAGAGVGRGQVIGSTDKNGAFVTDRPVSPADVAWTVYDSLGIDPAKELITPEGRPV
ncbi:MAG: DUF1501 domain-containing protein, partial [Burkholderiales bacterium]